MTTDDFRDFCNSILAPAFPEWSSWVRSNSPDPSATITTWASRFARITRQDADRVVGLIVAGQRQRPIPPAMLDDLANYCERIAMDRRKATEQRQSGQSYRDARHAMQSGNRDVPRFDVVAAVWRHYLTLARSGGTEAKPCYDEEPRYHREWAEHAMREDGLWVEGSELDDAGYRELAESLGVEVTAQRAPMVQEVPGQEDTQ